MICLIQRVSHGEVRVDKKTIGQIDKGLVVLTAFQPDDDSSKIDKMVHKLLHYRVFSDAEDKMNLNVQQIGGRLLLVPQFTLAADTQKGLRPSFSSSATPAIATVLFDEFIHKMYNNYGSDAIETGLFGADMQVSLTNDGPVTFWLEI